MTPLKHWMIAHAKDDEAVAAEVRSLGRELSRSQVNRLKNGASRPSYETAAALERLTGIPAGELFKQVAA